MMTTEALRQTIGALLAGTAFGNVMVHLFKEDIMLTSDLTPASFVEADYTGYVALAAADVGAVWDDENGNAVLSFAGVHFQPTGPTIGNTVFGFWVEGNDVGPLMDQILHMEKFPSPMSMNGTGDALDLVIKFRLGQPDPPGS